MRAVFLAMSAMVFGLTGPAAAQSAKAPIVVELYTSQGCSSCPPADAILGELAGRKDLIALALHVDYWDYIGWKDTFADHAYAQRQRAYARAAGEKMIYTPQMVVNGEARLAGSNRSELAAALKAKPDAAAPVLTLGRNGSRLSILATSQAALPQGTFVQLVRYIPAASVEVTRGENAGRTIEYNNIVTEWQKLGLWDGRSDLSLDVDAAGDQPVVVIIQAPGPGRILTAAVLR
jgi:hypothetical protein